MVTFLNNSTSTTPTAGRDLAEGDWQLVISTTDGQAVVTVAMQIPGDSNWLPVATLALTGHRAELTVPKDPFRYRVTRAGGSGAVTVVASQV